MLHFGLIRNKDIAISRPKIDNEMIVPPSNKPPPSPPRVLTRALTVYPAPHYIAFIMFNRTKKVKKPSKRQTTVNDYFIIYKSFS